MKRLAICGLTFLTACSGPPGAATAGNSPAGVTCRLPVVQWIQKAQGQEPLAGFLAFPGGSFSADPTALLAQDGDRFRTTVRPYLYGVGPGAGAYDWPLARWIPATPGSLSPDGSHVAYSQEFGAIHVIDVATGNERVLKALAGPGTVLYYAKEGIYFNQAWEGPPGPGLWLMDPNTGKIETVFTDQPVDAVGGFAAWIPDLNGADPHPVFSQYTGGNLPNQILRRDLNGGPTVRWLYQPGKTLNVIGFDQDKHPLIVVSGGEPSGANTVWQVPAADQGRAIYTGTEWAGLIADVHGIWFSDNHGVSLYTQSGGLRNLSTVRATLAGPCR